MVGSGYGRVSGCTGRGEAWGSRELCVRAHRPRADPWLQHVTLGTAALAPFVASFEMQPDRQRVGLAPRLPPPDRAERAARRTASCAPPARCTGQQSYVAARNQCEQPVCSAFFVSLDAESGTCVYSTSFRVIFALLLGSFAAAELLLFEAQHRVPALCSSPGTRGALLRILTHLWVVPTQPPP